MTSHSIHEMVAARAAEGPDRPALIWDGGSLSYGELRTRTARLAGGLRTAGVRTETPVGLFMPRGRHLIGAMLAILQAGGAYLPLDPDDPPERRYHVLADSGCRIVLTTPELRERLTESSPPDVTFLDVGDLPAGAPVHVPVDGSNLAYIIYTSGSTGRPKGVQVTHRSVVNLIRSDISFFDGDQVYLALAPIAFDASTFEVWGALCNGSRLVAPPDRLLDADEVADIAAAFGVTVLFLTKGLFNLFADGEVSRLSGLRQLVTGGDVLSPAHARQLLQRLPHTEITNAYGPAEATCIATVHRTVTTDDLATAAPIGRPITGAHVAVLGEDLTVVPRGAAGQLYVGGEGVARGYTDAARTAERFIPDPTVPGARMYATGDVVRQRADGTLEFLGRVDDQVKIRGFRVEPGEVEAILARCPGVEQACCVPRADAGGERAIAVYVVSADTGIVEAVHAYARRHLPRYMWPAWVVPVPRMPLTRNGKIDRGALPAPDAAAPPQASPPRDDMATVLTQVWREVLRLPEIDADRDFFDLGGTSLLLMRVRRILKRRHGIDVALMRLFEHPTVRSLAAHLSTRQEDTE